MQSYVSPANGFNVNFQIVISKVLMEGKSTDLAAN